jgi:hypothetical protein
MMLSLGSFGSSYRENEGSEGDKERKEGEDEVGKVVVCR